MSGRADGTRSPDTDGSVVLDERVMIVPSTARPCALVTPCRNGSGALEKVPAPSGVSGCFYHIKHSESDGETSPESPPRRPADATFRPGCQRRAHAPGPRAPLRHSSIQDDRAKRGLDSSSIRLEEWRQGEALAQVSDVLVDSEAGAVGCDLEENPTRLAEIDRREIIAINDGGDPQASRADVLTPRLLLRTARRPKGNVVNTTDSKPGRPQVRSLFQMHLRPRTAGPDREDAHHSSGGIP